MTQASAPRERLLLESESLAKRLGAPRLRVVDLRGLIRPPDAPKPWYLPKRDAYDAGHIPGAVFVDWTSDIVEPDAPVPMTLAGPQRFKALMERVGIGDDTEVVVYDDSGGLAPRLWWALNYYGHPDVRLLDGGWMRWVAEGRPVSTEVPQPPRATFTPRVDPAWRVGARDVRAALKDASTILVDCRSPKEFKGEITRGHRPGRIPGARHVPAVGLLEGDHRTWKSAAEIRAMYEAAGVTTDARVITYCNAGVSASVGLFGLALAGYPPAANFAGSWYEWEHDPSNPVTVGD